MEVAELIWNSWENGKKIVHLDGDESRHGSAGQVLKENRLKYLDI